MNGANVDYTAPGSGTSGSFTYTISDGHGGTATGTVTVALTPANAASPNVVVPPAIVDGKFKVTFAGIPGLTYTIERADNSSGPWTPFGTATAGGNGLFVVEDPDTSVSQRYYRTVYP